MKAPRCRGFLGSIPSLASSVTCHATTYADSSRRGVVAQRVEYLNANRQKIKEYRKKYYSEHREELCRKARTSYWEHTEQSAIRHKEYSKLNRDSIKEKHKEWVACNIEKIRERERDRSIKRTNELQPKYIRQLLKQQGFNPEDITLDLIEIKRAIIQINRKVKQSKTE